MSSANVSLAEVLGTLIVEKAIEFSYQSSIYSLRL